MICLTVALLPFSALAENPLPSPALVAQVERLMLLLSDAYAVGYPQSIYVQRVTTKQEKQLALTLFSVEGFFDGNGHTQYLAAFDRELNEEGDEHFRLLDVMPIGGKGWRGIDTIAAKFGDTPEGALLIILQGLGNGEQDAPNFPTQPVTVEVTLKGDRLIEVPAH